MDSNDTILFIVLIVLLALSAFFSSAETALTTVNRIRIRNLADEGNKNAKTVLKITDDSSKMLTAIQHREPFCCIADHNPGLQSRRFHGRNRQRNFNCSNSAFW